MKKQWKRKGWFCAEKKRESTGSPRGKEKRAQAPQKPKTKKKEKNVSLRKKSIKGTHQREENAALVLQGKKPERERRRGLKEVTHKGS